MSDLSDKDSIQMSMFDIRDKEREEKLDQTIDRIREMFGTKSIFRGIFANSSIEPVQGGVNYGNYIMMGGYKQ